MANGVIVPHGIRLVLPPEAGQVRLLPVTVTEFAIAQRERRSQGQRIIDTRRVAEAGFGSKARLIRWRCDDPRHDVIEAALDV